jgi:putative NADH-flavin reductase
MKLTIFGANGKTGTSLVRQALEAGHEVTAVVRDPARLAVPPHDHLRVVTADVMDPVAIASAVSGADIVVSAVGPHGRAATTILRDSTRSIITAMKKSGASRLMTVSGSMVDDTGDGFFLRHVGKPMTRRIFKGPCVDMRQAEDQIHASTLDWTILRPPRLTDKKGTRKYRTAIDRNLPHGFTLSRTDLATSILALSDDPKSIGKHVFMAN